MVQSKILVIMIKDITNGKCGMQGLNHFLMHVLDGLMLEMLPVHIFMPLKSLLLMEDIV